jgi:hypothetical protein
MKELNQFRDGTVVPSNQSEKLTNYQPQEKLELKKEESNDQPVNMFWTGPVSKRERRWQMSLLASEDFPPKHAAH